MPGILAASIAVPILVLRAKGSLHIGIQAVTILRDHCGYSDR